MESDRPYFNLESKFGRRIDIETSIDVEEVEGAVRRARHSRAHVSNTGQKQETNLLLRLPGELRNKIYELALGIDQDPASNIRVVCPSDGHESLSKGASLLRLCKQITVEVCSKLETQTTAYIPIMAHWNLNKLVSHIYKTGSATLPALQSTVFTGLTSFTHAHLHLHVYHEPSPYSGDLQPKIDLRVSNIYGVLRQALIIWCTASKQNFAHLSNDGRKRKAIVHLDHLIFD
ncbi:uncharacterized protein SETTUDRAFT_79515, partial [Exserohilum turcica Et28A]